MGKRQTWAVFIGGCECRAVGLWDGRGRVQGVAVRCGWVSAQSMHRQDGGGKRERESERERERKERGRDGRIGHAQGKREALFDCMWGGGEVRGDGREGAEAVVCGVIIIAGNLVCVCVCVCACVHVCKREKERWGDMRFSCGVIIFFFSLTDVMRRTEVLGSRTFLSDTRRRGAVRRGAVRCGPICILNKTWWCRFQLRHRPLCVCLRIYWSIDPLIVVWRLYSSRWSRHTQTQVGLAH